ncbi:MAG: hypothetical protein GF317_02320 [Candidatus Lokiarchaeota archaeon]|nr:hypothetical protein [Candidatus Lokiarchaeota archaeon]MBD3198743.1 hypothetical protein [Candidatus Lokiarchaeota archaeon]
MQTNKNSSEIKKSPMMNKEEINYLKMCKKYPQIFIQAHRTSKQEGFEYFYSGVSNKNAKKKFLSRIWHVGDGLGVFGRLKRIWTMIGNFRKIMKGKKQCYSDLEVYYKNLEQAGKITQNTNSNLRNTYPNKELWKELSEYADKKWNVKLGFTKLPEQLIFKGKGVLFRYALVCIQEMEKEKIDQAPKKIAGVEVMRVYATLGFAVNDIAEWLRSRGVNCQSNHPLGGLVNTPPLAGKAGLGWIGRHGLLITPEFGPRHRIAPILIENKTFEYTDSTEHRWIEQWCKNCGKCQKECPTQAIYSEKQVSIENVAGISNTRTCINRDKCFPYFNETFGCSVCIKVCPFSKGITSYKRLKKVVKDK